MLSSLYEDDEILVIDKPAGLASQPGEGVRVSVLEAVERDFGFRPYLVHRLDKETAGCLVVARTSQAASKWTGFLESRELRKTYREVVSGEPSAESGRFDEPVRGLAGDRKAARPALTEWRLVASFGASQGEAPRFSYLELVLGTGRTHQIRLHLASHGLPILGDDRHGDFALNKRLKAERGLRRLLLVAWSLELPGGALVRAPAPEHLAVFLASFDDAPGPDAPCAESSP